MSCTDGGEGRTWWDHPGSLHPAACCPASLDGATRDTKERATEGPRAQRSPESAQWRELSARTNGSESKSSGSAGPMPAPEWAPSTQREGLPRHSLQAQPRPGDSAPPPPTSTVLRAAAPHIPGWGTALRPSPAAETLRPSASAVAALPAGERGRLPADVPVSDLQALGWLLLYPKTAEINCDRAQSQLCWKSETLVPGLESIVGKVCALHTDTWAQSPAPQKGP